MTKAPLPEHWPQHLSELAHDIYLLIDRRPMPTEMMASRAHGTDRPTGRFVRTPGESLSIDALGGESPAHERP